MCLFRVCLVEVNCPLFFFWKDIDSFTMLPPLGQQNLQISISQNKSLLMIEVPSLRPLIHKVKRLRAHFQEGQRMLGEPTKQRDSGVVVSCCQPDPRMISSTSYNAYDACAAALWQSLFQMRCARFYFSKTWDIHRVGIFQKRSATPQMEFLEILQQKWKIFLLIKWELYNQPCEFYRRSWLAWRNPEARPRLALLLVLVGDVFGQSGTQPGKWIHNPKTFGTESFRISSNISSMFRNIVSNHDFYSFFFK